MLPVQFKDSCGIAVVHPGRENGTWKGMDCLEIREFKELFHVKLNEKAVADILKNNFGFDCFVFFLPKAQKANFHSQLGSV